LNARALLFTAEGALRAPWRIAVFIAATVASGVVTYALLTPAAAALGPQGTGLEWFTWIGLGATVGGTAVALRVVDGRLWSDIGLGPASARPRHFAEGWLLGTLAIGLPAVLLLAVDWLALEPSRPGSWAAAALRVSAVLLPAALAEELLFRGYAFAVLREWVGWGPTLALTSVAFGFAHVDNPGASLRALALVMLAGVFLGTIVLVTRSLYAAWMAHFAWNWVMAVLLHSRVSGLGLDTPPDYRTVDAGPDWATGGAWGPEGGAAAALGMTGGLAYLFARRRSQRSLRG